MMPNSTQEAAKSAMRARSCTEGEASGMNQPPPPQQSSIDMDDAPYRARLYQLFGLIEKEFDALYAENCALRGKIAQLTENEVDSCVLSVDASVGETKQPGSGKKAMQMGQKLRTALRGPPGRLVFKADGSRFRLWRRMEGHRDGVWHVAADTARSICASASADQTARVWALDTGTCLGTYTGHSGSVNCVAISPTAGETSELLFATASGDESTHIWRMHISGGQATASSEEEEDEKDNLDGFVEGHDKHSGVTVRMPLLRLTGHRAPVICCDWLSGGHQLISASWDRTANIFDVEKGEVINILSGHEQELNNCSAHLSQKLVATSSKDSTFRLWDFRESIQSVAVFQGHQESVTSVAFSSGDRIVSGSDDRTVKVWDLRNMRSALSTIRLSSGANRVSVSKTHGVIAIPLDNRHVRIYDLNGNRLPRIPNLRCHSRMVTCAAWVDDNSSCNLLTSGFDRTVASWKIALNKDSC